MLRIGSDRRALLLGTALASTLIFGGVLAPAPAHATTDCLATSPPAPAPIFTNVADSITCVNTEARNGTGYAISLNSSAPGGFIDLYNSGVLTAANAASFASGIATYAQQVNSPITIENVANISATSTAQNANGIAAFTGIGSIGSGQHREQRQHRFDRDIALLDLRLRHRGVHHFRRQPHRHREQRRSHRNRWRGARYRCARPKRGQSDHGHQQR
jgi:hypothetical protein